MHPEVLPMNLTGIYKFPLLVKLLRKWAEKMKLRGRVCMIVEAHPDALLGQHLPVDVGGVWEGRVEKKSTCQLHGRIIQALPIAPPIPHDQHECWHFA